MTSYYVHLGFDWKGYEIGSVWGSAGNSNYWLQYELTRQANNKASLWQFASGDFLLFRIWDLTGWADGELPGTQTNTISVSGGVGMNSPDGDTIWGMPASSTDYGALLNPSAECSWGSRDEDDSNDCIILADNFDMSYPGLSSSNPWQRGSGCAAPTKDSSFPSTNVYIASMAVRQYAYMYTKINFQLTVTYNGDKKTFIADPEGYMGSGKNT